MGAVQQPGQVFRAEVVLVGVAGLDIGALQHFEPAADGALLTRLGGDQRLVQSFSLGAEKLNIVGAREIEGVEEEEARVGKLEVLVSKIL